MGREFLNLVDISEAHRIIRNLFKEIYHPPRMEKVNLKMRMAESCFRM